MDSDQYVPDGTVQGDPGGMPNKGTGTGLNGDTYGADIGQSATNRIGGITGATKSDDGTGPDCYDGDEYIEAP